MRLSLLICCLVVIGFPAEMSGTDTPVPPPLPGSPSISIRIETGRLSPSAGVDTVDLIMESDSALGGFDFKVMSRDRQIKIVKILPGRFIDSCRWEFFEVRELTVSFDDGRSEQPVWQVTALPELIPDSVKPTCYSFGRPISLCRLVVSTAHSNPETAEPEQDPPEMRLLFVWEDCSDNTISSFGGNELWLSSYVAGWDSLPARAVFPDTSGNVKSCLTVRNSDRVKRLIDFQGGTIVFQKDEVKKPPLDSSDS